MKKKEIVRRRKLSLWFEEQRRKCEKLILI